jgi:hypothetical protein
MPRNEWEMFLSPELHEKIEKGEVSPSVSMWRNDRGELEVPDVDPKNIVTTTEHDLTWAIAQARLDEGEK